MKERSNDTNKALAYAYKLLGIKDYFLKDLSKKLSTYFTEDATNFTISYMQEKGYIDDERLAFSYTLSKLNQGYGPYYILSKLFDKGVEKDEAFIDSIIEKEQIDFSEYFNKSIEKCIKRYQVKNIENCDYKAYLSCINHLKSRGFSLSRIMQAVKLNAFACLNRG